MMLRGTINRRYDPRRIRAQGGFSLVETIMVGVVVTMIASGVMSTLPPMMRSVDEATRLEHVTSLLEHVIAECGEVPFENLGALDGVVVDHAALAGTDLADLQGYRVQIEVVEMRPALKKLELVVFHRPTGSSGAVEKAMLRSAVLRARR